MPMIFNKNAPRKFVLVFGSNEAGVHGAGAARTAMEQYGALWGHSYGHYGQSFAIPTKDSYIVTMPIERIERYIHGFLAYANGHRKLNFLMTQLGCGLAGLQPIQVAPLFLVPGFDLDNVYFDTAWKPYIGDNAPYWGTYSND